MTFSVESYINESRFFEYCYQQEGSTHEGELLGIPTTGNKLEFSSTIIIKIEDGKVVEEREDADMLGFMMQLGMELKLKEGEK